MNDTSFERRLRVKLAEMEKTRADNILSGTLSPDDYKKLTGYVGALHDITAVCDEIRAEMEQG